MYALCEIKHIRTPVYWWTSYPAVWPSPCVYLSFWICYYLQTIRQSWCNVLLQISSLFLCLVMQHSGQEDLSSLIKTKRQKSEKIADMVKRTKEAFNWTDWVLLLLYFFCIHSFSKFSSKSSKHSVLLKRAFGSYLLLCLESLWNFCINN